eukprot:641256-Pleurochrysis_carterae.AAC.1
MRAGAASSSRARKADAAADDGATGGLYGACTVRKEEDSHRGFLRFSLNGERLKSTLLSPNCPIELLELEAVAKELKLRSRA